MNNIRVDIRLRPIRFGFLVRPDDAENILEIFRINTCLWGGTFNPIIPLFECVPSRWERDGFRFENTKQIVNGYLDFFEPDFLVEAEEGLAAEFCFDPKRVLQLIDISDRTGEKIEDRYGLSVYGLYRELYAKGFQFEQRHKHNVVHVKSTDAAFTNFVAANFGDFPIQGQFGYFEREYEGIFDPEHIALDAAALSKLYQSGYSSALEIGCAKLQINFHRNLMGPALFILDAHDAKDLIDYWDLRAVHQHVIAVPIQWIEELSPFCKEFIQSNYCHRRSNRNADMIHPTLMFSRFMSENDREELHENYLRVDMSRGHILLAWDSHIWRKPSGMEDRTTRPTVAADRKSRDVQIASDNPEIRFNPLFPEFSHESGYRFRLANVVRLQDWRNTGKIATVFPCNYKQSAFFKTRSASEPPLYTTEGFVIFPESRNLSEQWNLDVSTALNQWLSANQVSVTPSDAGRATQQIIQTFEGFEDVGCLAHKGVIELLNKISKRPVSKTVHYQKFRKKIDRAISNEISGKSIFETLVKRKAVELGLDLKCSTCSSWSWYSVKQLDYSLNCSFCFRQFDFPVIDPVDKKHSKWAYRLIGPFTQPDYAKGGYAAALAIRFIAYIINRRGCRSEIAWSSGQELGLRTGRKVEADFILWHQRKAVFGLDYPTATVFGEAKSFSRFEPDDVDKMKVLAEAIPGSILVFATMKQDAEFSKKEISRIRELAEWGREYDEDRQQTRAPVITLTGTELFTEYTLEETWEKNGGKFKNLIGPTRRPNNLKVLADLTQRLYLGMPPYGLP